MIQRNKNLLNDLLAKHNYETKRTVECVKQTLENAKIGDQALVSNPTINAKQATTLPTAGKKAASLVATVGK